MVKQGISEFFLTIEYVICEFNYSSIHTGAADPLKHSSVTVMDQRIRRIFTKAGNEGLRIHLWDFSLRHFIFMLINSDLSQMEAIFLKGYDIQGLLLWLIPTYGLLHWVFQSEKETFNSVYEIWDKLCAQLLRD